MPDRSYEGDPLDLTWQDIKDRPYKGEGETVYVTEREGGVLTTEGTPHGLEQEPDDNHAPSVELPDGWNGPAMDTEAKVARHWAKNGFNAEREAVSMVADNPHTPFVADRVVEMLEDSHTYTITTDHVETVYSGTHYCYKCGGTIESGMAGYVRVSRCSDCREITGPHQIVGA